MKRKIKPCELCGGSMICVDCTPAKECVKCLLPDPRISDLERKCEALSDLLIARLKAFDDMALDRDHEKELRVYAEQSPDWSKWRTEQLRAEKAEICAMALRNALNRLIAVTTADPGTEREIESIFKSIPPDAGLEAPVVIP